MDLILTLLWRYKMENYWMSEALSVQANLDHARTRIEQLENFVKDVKELALKHDVIACTNGNRYASVNPKKIDEAILKVDKEWKTV
jgi:hypothetical protein